MLRALSLSLLFFLSFWTTQAQNVVVWPHSVTSPVFIDVTSEQLGFSPIIHPGTTGSAATPCGLETFFIGARQAGLPLVIATDSGYQLVLAPTVQGFSGEPLTLGTFYASTFVNSTTLEEHQHRLSAGNVEVAAFEFLMADLAYQFSEWTVRRDFSDYQPNTPVPTAIANLGRRRLREAQMVTGLMPVRYVGDLTVDGIPGDRLAALYNRTHVASLMNLFYGQPGEMYLLPLEEPLESSTLAIEDMNLEMPLVDNEFLLIPDQDPQDIRVLLEQWQSENRIIIFRISKYRFQARASAALGLPAYHYFVVIDDPRPAETRNDPEPVVAIYDTLNPFQVLLVPVSQIPQLFTTVTVSPQG